MTLSIQCFEYARAKGFPRLALSPSETILGGEDGWKLFADRAFEFQVRAAMLALDDVPVQGEAAHA
jgi:hypothetical protein